MGANTGVSKQQKARHVSVFLENTDACRAFSFQTLGLARNKKPGMRRYFPKIPTHAGLFLSKKLHTSAGNFSPGQSPDAVFCMPSWALTVLRRHASPCGHVSVADPAFRFADARGISPHRTFVAGCQGAMQHGTGQATIVVYCPMCTWALLTRTYCNWRASPLAGQEPSRRG